MRKISFLVVVALLVSACGTGGDGDRNAGQDSAASSVPGSVAPSGMVVDGKVTDAALAEIVADDGTVDGARMNSLTAEVAAMSDDDREAVLADLSARAEVGIASVSGLLEETGGEQGFLTAAAEAWAPVDDLVRTAVPSPSSGLRSRSTATAPAELSPAMGLFMGFMGLGMTAGALVSSSNRADPDVVQTSDGDKDGMTATSSLNAVSLGLQYKGTEKDGMEIEFSAKSELQVCPAENGLLDVSGLIDVTTRKNGKVQHATVDAKMRVQVGDDAEAVSKDGEVNITWSATDGLAEQSIDATYTTGSKQDYKVNGFNIFATTPEFVRAAVALGHLVGDLVLLFLFDAVERGWKSGRCVELSVTPSAGPSGLEPGASVTVQAQPRSKIDRSPTGGTVSAVLSAGENAVDPSSTPLQADAEFTYTAPGEKDKSGTVDFESKSKRGIGKASITFDTNSIRYKASYGGGGVTISGEVASLSNPFDLDAEFTGGTAVFSFVPDGEAGGSFTINGGGSQAVVTGGGTYTVKDNGDGTKILAAVGEACVDVSGICSEVDHPIVLTPIK